MKTATYGLSVATVLSHYRRAIPAPYKLANRFAGWYVGEPRVSLERQKGAR